MTPIPKTTPWRSKKYMEWVSTLPCVICNRPGQSDPHHVRIFGNAGTGQKPDDCWCIPLCREHHNEIHSIGMYSFQERHNVLMVKLLMLVCQEWIKKDG